MTVNEVAPSTESERLVKASRASGLIGKGARDEIREAKLYFTAFRNAHEAKDATNAERWKIGNDFIAEHGNDESEDALSAPPRPQRGPDGELLGLYQHFYADAFTDLGDAEVTYDRLMRERHPVEVETSA